MKRLPYLIVSGFMGLLNSNGVLASVEIDVNLNFLDTVVSGNCELLLSHDEPYSHISSACTLNKGESAENSVTISNYEIGWPRPVIPPFYKTWPTLSVNPEGETEYCQVFADYFGDINLGHHTNSNENLALEGIQYCDTSPAPPDDCVATFTSSLSYCRGPKGVMQLSVDLAGFFVSNAHYEKKLGAGSWETVWNGAETCPATMSIGGFLARALLQTPYGDSSCQISVNVPPCEPEPEW